MGLGFYIIFFTFINMRYILLGNYILLFSVLTAVLGGMVVYFLSIAFSPSQLQSGGKESKYNFLNMSTTASGFIGGFITMVAIILMILAFRAESLGLMNNIGLFDAIHPIVTFFLTVACTILIVWPEIEED